MKVIITGASMGIGRGIAMRLAEHGHALGLIARSDDKLGHLGNMIRAKGGRCEVAPCDLRDQAATQAAIEGLIKSLEGVDALINNAGIVLMKSVWDIEPAEWRDLFETNVHGLFYATQAVLPAFKAQQSGHIINISSVSGRVPLPGGSAYAATKYAVTGFSESLFQEVRDEGIKVSVIFPGSVDSQSHRHDPHADHSWKVQPEEVGQACHDILNTAPHTCISLLEIRPARKPAPRARL